MSETVPMRRRRARTQNKKPFWREALEWVITFGAAYLAAFLISTFVFQLIPVEGESMTQTLQDGERMFVTKFTYMFRQPERQEIVITHYPDSKDIFVKRVIGLPGDTVAVHDGQVYLNGAPLQEPYIREQEIRYTMEEMVVPEGHVFVMGDNRNYSMDSHSLSVGPLPLDYLVGKVQCVVWPLGHIRGVAYHPPQG